MGAPYFRAHQRFTVDIEIVALGTSRALRSRGRILDLGLGGAACELEHPVRLGEALELKLAAAGEETSLLGRVAWVAWSEHSAVRAGLPAG